MKARFKTAALSLLWILLLGPSNSAAQAPSVVDGSQLKATEASLMGVLFQREGGRLRNPIVEIRPSRIDFYAKKTNSLGDIKVKFEQTVARETDDSVDAFLKFFRRQNGQLPKAYEVRISFEDGFAPREDGSSGLACALALQTLISGEKWNSQVVAMGGIDSNGAVVGATLSCNRIFAASDKGAPVLLVPQSGESFVPDTMMIHGPQVAWNSQILSVATLDDAIAIGKPVGERPPEIEEAIQQFAEIQTVLQKQNNPNLLKNQHVISRLREIVQAVPNHLSAKYLLLYGMGRFPNKLSEGGSYYAIDYSSGPALIRMAENYSLSVTHDLLTANEFDEIERKLMRVRRFAHADFVDAIDAIVEFCEGAENFINNAPKTFANRKKAETEVAEQFQLMKTHLETVRRNSAVIRYLGN